MARALFNTWLTDTEGDVVPNGTLVLYEADGTTPLAANIYAAAAGGSPLGTTTLTANAVGYAEAYADAPQAIAFTPSGGTSTQSGFWDRDPVTLTGAQTLTNKTLTAPILTDAEIEDAALAGNVRRRETGPMVFDVEGYADEDDLNADGTFKNDADASTAINLATAAIRAQTTGPTNPGGWSSSRALRFNSPIYTISRTLNFTYLTSCSLVANTPGAAASFYCADSWAGPPVGSAGDGVITAAQSPMADCTGMANCTVVGLTMNAQKLLLGNPAPTTRPAVGWLVAATETWNGSAWAGTNGDSNNNTFMSCAGVGWAKYADWAFVGSVISTMHACGGQSWSNEENSMSLYAGCVPLSTVGDPDTAGTAFDSPFYPNDGSPSASQKRMLRTELGGSMSELVIIRSEFHDMAPIASGADPDVQTNRKRTMLFHRINGLKILDVPISCSGVAQIELWGQCQNVDLEMTQNYNKGTSGARSNYFIRMMGVSDANPIKGLRWHNHMGGTAPQIGWIGCGDDAGNNAPCFFGMDVGGNVLGTSVPFFKTLGVYGGAAATVNLTNSVIDLCSTDVELGGSIGPSVTFFNAGDSFQYSSSGGTDNSTKIGGETDGGVIAPFLGASPGTRPTTGAVRLPISTGVHSRTVGGTNVNLLGLDGSDVLQIGQAASLSSVDVNAANGARVRIGGTTKVAVNANVEIGTAALATNATAGFLCISTSAGPPTGNPSPTAGLAPLHYDSTNNQLYVFFGGTWRATAALT